MDDFRIWAHNFFNPATVRETFREIAARPKPLLYVVLIVVLAAWLVISAIRKFKRPRAQRQSTPDLEKPAARTLSKFKAPERQPGGRYSFLPLGLILANLWPQCGFRLISRDQPRRPIRIGMCTLRNLYHIDPLDTDRTFERPNLSSG